VLFFEQFFSYVSFFPCANNTHIFSPAHVVPLAFNDFVSKLAYVKLAIQLCKCLGWALFNLPFGFTFALNFCCIINNIRILCDLFGFGFFSSLFLQEVLNEDVRHVDAFLKLRDV
jgi:hypothetical protein